MLIRELIGEKNRVNQPAQNCVGRSDFHCNGSAGVANGSGRKAEPIQPGRVEEIEAEVKEANSNTDTTNINKGEVPSTIIEGETTNVEYTVSEEVKEAATTINEISEGAIEGEVVESILADGIKEVKGEVLPPSTIYGQHIFPVIQDSGLLKEGQWIVADSISAKTLLLDFPNSSILYKGKRFHVTLLTLEFLNPATRDKELTPYVLMELKK